jgi:hypothetical protein
MLNKITETKSLAVLLIRPGVGEALVSKYAIQWPRTFDLLRVCNAPFNRLQRQDGDWQLSSTHSTRSPDTIGE